MKILLINQFFWPDSAATSQLLTDLARELAAQGHQVEVICGGTYAATDHTDAPVATIHRVRGLSFSRGPLGRVLSYLTFYLGAAWRVIVMSRPEVIVTLTTPPLLSVIGALGRRLRGARFFIWEMDMYPDVAVDLEYIRAGSLLARITGILADWARRQADGIIALGDCMSDRLQERGVAAEKISVVHNWADSRQIRVLPSPSDSSTLQVVYSGNLGLAHDFETIGQAMLKLRHDSRFSFTFIGGGSLRGQLTDLVTTNELTSVSMKPYVPRADLSEVLGTGDIGLVTQRDECCGTVVPSKVYGLMAAGRPILFIGPAAATPARIIRAHACGWHVSCGDSDALVRLLQHLATHRDEITLAGKNARLALETHYDSALGTSRIANILTENSRKSVPSTTPVQVTSGPVTTA